MPAGGRPSQIQFCGLTLRRLVDNTDACMILTDQRGYPRDDGACDSGSFEYRVPVTALLKLEVDTINRAETTSATRSTWARISQSPDRTET